MTETRDPKSCLSWVHFDVECHWSYAGVAKNHQTRESTFSRAQPRHALSGHQTHNLFL